MELYSPVDYLSILVTIVPLLDGYDSMTILHIAPAAHSFANRYWSLYKETCDMLDQFRQHEIDEAIESEEFRDIQADILRIYGSPYYGSDSS